jgi:predicted Zn finger-like uncharacterized protein
LKFLCEQCKAKYQISDEKVAGKTVRMKCRKCGHMIEVRAEITETSVAKALPTGEISATARPRPMDPPRPGAGIPPRPGPAQTSGVRAPARGALATSLSSARRSDPGASAGRATQDRPQSTAPGALAGAFQKAVGKQDESALDMLSISASHEWYVAINGVPVGPVRVSELRRKAALGAVTEDSLVWQEGLEEWRPVRAVTELAGLVREALAHGRPSLIAPEPSSRQSLPPPSTSPSRPPLASRPSGIPPRPAMRSEHPGMPSAMARSNVVPFTGASRLATAEKLDHLDDSDLTEVHQPNPFGSGAQFGSTERSSLVAADPFAVPPPAGGMAGGMAGGIAAAMTPAQPGFGMSGPSPALGSPFAGSQSLSSPISLGAPVVVAEPRARKAPPWIPIAMVAAATAFGVVAAIAIFFRAPPAPVVIQAPTASAIAPPPPSATEDTSAAPTDSTAIELPAAPDKSGHIATGGPRATGAPPAASSGAKGVDLSSLLQGGPGGPAAAGGGGGAAGGGGSSLDGPAIEGVVRSRAGGVKRTCWERGASQQSSVNVTCRVAIAANGSVSSATAKGDDPAIAKCIENSVRSWTFPASGGSTTVDIPFHFVRQ